MAQLGDQERARQLLKLAARRFGNSAPVARARCQIAEAEICLATRELAAFPRGFMEALALLDTRGDRRNVVHGRLLSARRCILLGHLASAEESLSRLELPASAPALSAIAMLCQAEIQLRRVQAKAALETLKRAKRHASSAKIPALQLEVENTRRLASQPAARLMANGELRVLSLLEVEALFARGSLVVDGCRRALRQGPESVGLARRPVLFALLQALASEPAGADRSALILAAFGARRSNESHRARLRVEIGRLRRLIRPLCDIEATPRGFRLAPRAHQLIELLQPPVPGDSAALQALLADGQSWSTSALALALGESQRNVQRALADLESQKLARAVGRGRAQRWVAAPLNGITTTLLLPLNVADG